MDELVLNDELYTGMFSWMDKRYALTTQRQRLYFLSRIAKQYSILNKETVKSMFKKFRYQYQRAALSMINDYCADANIDFFIRLPRLKVKKREKFPDLLSYAEIARMIEATPKPYNLAIRCIFNFGAGLRISEIIKFSWSHIRWIDWLANKDNYGVSIIRASKGSKDRVVNIPKNLMRDLYEYAREENLLDEFGVPQGNMIFNFSSDKNKKRDEELWAELVRGSDKAKASYILTRYNWFRYNILQKYCEKALGKKIKIHSLRHSRSTYLYEYEKLPIEKIQLLLGHSSINTTMLYTKINPVSVFDLLKETKEL